MYCADVGLRCVERVFTENQDPFHRLVLRTVGHSTENHSPAHICFLYFNFIFNVIQSRKNVLQIFFSEDISEVSVSLLSFFFNPSAPKANYTM